LALTDLNLSVTTQHYKYLSLCLFFFFCVFPWRFEWYIKKDRPNNKLVFLVVEQKSGDASLECRWSMLLITNQGTVTFTFKMELLLNYLLWYPVIMSTRLGLFFREAWLRWCFLRASRTPQVLLHNTICIGSSVTWTPESNRFQDSSSWIPDSKSDKFMCSGIRIPLQRVATDYMGKCLFWPRSAHNCDDIVSLLCFNLY